jgi:hypothetical protein
MDPLVMLLHHLELRHRDLYGTGEVQRRFPPIGPGVRGESRARRAARGAWDALKRLHHEATATWVRRLESPEVRAALP